MTSHRMRYKIGLTEYNVAIKDHDILGGGSGIPVGTIISYLGSVLPGGFLWCDGSSVSRLMYPDLFDVIGITYGSGDGETTFALPDLDNGEFLEGSSSAGTSKDAGLPNIEGEVAINNNCGFILSTAPSSGALIKATQYPYFLAGSSGSSYGLGLDASQSNAIYGNSATVQPKSLTVRFIIKAFDEATANSGLIDLTQYAGDLANKSTRSLSNLTQSGEDHFLEKDWCYIYPNGGTAENPASITTSNRYVESNPFLGYIVSTEVELYIKSMWGKFEGFILSGSSGYGVTSSQIEDSILIQTGSNALVCGRSDFDGSPFRQGAGDPEVMTALCRVKVWKVGKIQT